MSICVRYWSWFRDITGTDHEQFDLPAGTRVAGILEVVHRKHPRLAAARQSTLVAVGLDYQTSEFALKEGDEVSLFPPVQGG